MSLLKNLLTFVAEIVGLGVVILLFSLLVFWCGCYRL